MDKSYEKYTDLILKLMGLIADGRGDTDEADDVRDDLDVWHHQGPGKPPREIPKWLEDLTGDLYMLQDQSMYFILPEGETVEDHLLRLDNAVKSNRWEEVLNLLKGSLGLKESVIAEYRGLAWLALGYERVAEPFLSFAEKLKQEDK